MLDINDVNVGDYIILNKTSKAMHVVGKDMEFVFGTNNHYVLLFSDQDSLDMNIDFLVEPDDITVFIDEYEIDISNYLNKYLRWCNLKDYLLAVLVPKESLKENKPTQVKTVGDSFYEICLQEAKQKTKKENEQRPVGSAFEFL
jgi:hypothetical protein